MKSDGKILTSYLLTTADIGENKVTENCSLCTQTLTDIYNVTLNSVTYDEKNYSTYDYSTKFTFNVTNNSSCNITNLKLQLSDKSGNKISDYSLPITIKSGETKEFIDTIYLGGNGSASEYTFTVLPPQTDYDPSDNAITKSIGYSDLGLFVTAVDKGSDAGIYLNVSNNNKIRTAANVIVRANDENGIILDQFCLGAIDGLSENNYYIESNKVKNYLKYCNNVYVTVKSYTPEIYLLDNSAPIYIGDMECQTSDSNIVGDADLDNSISIYDATLIQKYIASIFSLSEKAKTLSDVDFNNNIDINIQYYLANLNQSTNVGKDYTTIKPTEPTTQPTTQPTTRPITQPTTQQPNTKMIYFYNSNGWSSPYAYYWKDNDTNMTKWPGMAMTRVSGNYYSIVVPKDTQYIIFSNNDSSQTADLRIDSSYNCYYNRRWTNY